MENENKELEKNTQEGLIKQIPLIERWNNEPEVGFTKPTEKQKADIKEKMEKLGLNPEEVPEVKKISQEEAKKILGFE